MALVLTPFAPTRQFYDDPWTQTCRECVFRGECAVCRKPTFAFTDGGNDPRGPLGLHASAALYAADYGAIGKPVPLCAECADDFGRYKAALAHAWLKHWTRC